MKEEQNEKQQASKNQQEAKASERQSVKDGQTQAQAAQTFSLRRLTSKKWVFPAVYLAAAAIILSVMWAVQNDNEPSLLSEEDSEVISQEVDGSENALGDDALPVVGNAETMEWPVMNVEDYEVLRPFYEEGATNEAKQAAMIEYGNRFIPSTGITIAQKDGESFDVLAALSGTVTFVEENPLLGQIVEVTHEDGLKTVYHSLSAVAVEENEQVIRGQVIAKSGRSEYGQDLVEHVHFEVHEDGEPVNPVQLLPVAD